MQRAYTQDGGKKQYAIPNTQNPVSHPNEIRNKLKVNKMGALGTQLARAINSVFLDVDENTYDNLIRMGQALEVTGTSNGAIFPAAGCVETINLVVELSRSSSITVRIISVPAPLAIAILSS